MAVALERPVISLIGFSNPLRTGPYRRYDDLVVNAYGEMWTRDTLATDRRPDRMHVIDVRDVLEKVELWRERYRDSRRGV